MALSIATGLAHLHMDIIGTQVNSYYVWKERYKHLKASMSFVLSKDLKKRGLHKICLLICQFPY